GRLTAAIIHPADGFAAEKPMLKLGPISVETAGTSVLSEPHWKARAADDYLHAALVPGGDQSGVIAAYDLAAMPFAALAGAVHGRKRNTVCTRVAVRFRLLDKQADDYLYDRTLIASSGFMEIKELSGEPGRALFVQELTSNIHALVEQFFQEANPSQNSDNPQ